MTSLRMRVKDSRSFWVSWEMPIARLLRVDRFSVERRWLRSLEDFSASLLTAEAEVVVDVDVGLSGVGLESASGLGCGYW